MGRQVIALHAGEGRRTAVLSSLEDGGDFEPIGWFSANIPVTNSRRLEPRELEVRFQLLRQYARLGGRIEPARDTLTVRIGHTGPMAPLVAGDLTDYTHRRHIDALPDELALGALAGFVDASRSLPVAAGNITITHASYDPVESGSQAFKAAAALLLWAMLQSEAELDTEHWRARFELWRENWFTKF